MFREIPEYSRFSRLVATLTLYNPDPDSVRWIHWVHSDDAVLVC